MKRLGRRIGWACAVGMLIALVLPAPVGAATPGEVNDAVDKAVKYLYDVQQNGNWEISAAPQGDDNASVTGRQWGGLTAMATYALLAAGENPQDPRVAKALNWLLDNELSGTYAVGLRAQVWQFLPEKHPQRSLIRAAIKRDRDLLINGFNAKEGSGGYGFWGYFPKQNGHWDLSNSQYAVLGVWATEQAGAEVPRKFWEIQDAAWRKQQNPDGGWGYNEGRKDSSPNMAAAGVATLFITQDYLIDLRRDCQGNVNNTNIDMGLAFMDRHVNQLLDGNFYGMYGVERIGVASGRKYFGTLDWYEHGSDFLVKHQKPDGSWGEHDAHNNAKGIPNTCFSIYFLTRGRAPVLMNKLEYSTAGRDGRELGWNQRPRDLSNFTKWMTRNLDGRFTNWQVVNLKVQPHELHDAPILYVAGSEALTFKDEEAARLRQFVEEGGLILGNADCGNAKFVKSFTALGRRMFPAYEFRDLEQNHPLLTNQQFNAGKWKRKPKVLSLGNGVRELMVLVPNDDLSKAWQTHSDRTKEELFMLPANVYLYAVKEAYNRYKGETYIVQDTGKGKPERSIKVGRLMVGNNPDPEPGGWRRLGNVFKNASLATLVVEPVKPGEGKLKGYKVAHLTGTTKLKLSQAQRDEIRAFLDGGGTLVVDAAGGSAEFADAAADELAAILGDSTRKTLTQPLPPTHGVYAMADMKLEKFGYRDFAKGRVVGRLNAPRMSAVEANGRVVAFYSRDDLSAGLVGNPVDGILGYDAETATAIMRNVVVYAETGGKGIPPAAKDGDKKGQKSSESPIAKNDAKSPAKPKPAKAGGRK
jgi:hypothetical protein